MALPLHIPPCIHKPSARFHPPPPDQPLRIQIEGPLTSIQKLIPHITWDLNFASRPPLQPAAPELARLTYQTVYGRDASEVPGDLVVRDEYLGWIRHTGEIDYYGVTFDHFVPADDTDPEVLQININEMDYDRGAYTNSGLLLFVVDPDEYIGKKVLAVPRCCQRRKGTTDRERVNFCVARREKRMLPGDDNFPLP